VFPHNTQKEQLQYRCASLNDGDTFWEMRH